MVRLPERRVATQPSRRLAYGLGWDEARGSLTYIANRSEIYPKKNKIQKIEEKDRVLRLALFLLFFLLLFLLLLLVLGGIILDKHVSIRHKQSIMTRTDIVGSSLLRLLLLGLFQGLLLLLRQLRFLW